MRSLLLRLWQFLVDSVGTFLWAPNVELWFYLCPYCKGANVAKCKVRYVYIFDSSVAHYRCPECESDVVVTLDDKFLNEEDDKRKVYEYRYSLFSREDRGESDDRRPHVWAQRSASLN